VTNPNFPVVQRGEIYYLDWSPSRGSEQAGLRPALVIQENPASSNSNYPLTIVAAVSSKGRSIPSHVAVQPTPSNGLTVLSYIKCEQIQTVSKGRLQRKIGDLDATDMGNVEQALKKVLALP
jgi:mRNA interferase MazF